MEPRPDTAEDSIEKFADACARLAALEQARATVLRAAGASEGQWPDLSAAWARRMTAAHDEARDLSDRFRRAYQETAAAVGAPGMEAPALVAPPEPCAPPAVQTPSFLLPPPEVPANPRGESPWACTVPTSAIACRAPLPFRAADSASAGAVLVALGAQRARDWVGPGKLAQPGRSREPATIALADLPALPPRATAVPFAPHDGAPPPRAAAEEAPPPFALDEEDTERTVMGPPADWPPKKVSARGTTPA